MGKVSDKIRELIERQVADRGTVVWYDPEKVYASLAKSLVVDDATVLVGDTGFFRLRERLEPLLEFVTPDGEVTPGCGVPPNVVVYVPEAREKTEFALIEAESAGTVMEPGAEVAERNTRLQAIVEQVFTEIAPEKAAHVARQAEEGLLTLEELDRMADEAGSVTAGALKLIFGPISPAEVLLEFAASDKYDKKIAEKKAQGELVTLAGDELGLTGADTTSLANFRKTLQRHLLLGELVHALPEPSRPGPLAAFELPATPVHQQAIRHLCHIWRNRVDLQEEYEDAADALEQAAGLAPLALPESAIAGLDTFAFIENRLLHAAVANLVAGDAEGVLALMAKRRESFWCRRRAEFPLVWSLVDAGAQLLAMGMNIRQALKKRKWTARELVEAYTRHTEPWMVLDRSARHLESRYARCEMSAAPSEPGLEQLVTHCRKAYAETLAVLAETYSSALEQSGFEVESFAPQSHVFADRVSPLLKAGEKVAYLLVDALRFEMAAELVAGLGDEFEVTTDAAIGQLPGITPIGMAALMPGAEKGLALDKTGAGLVVQIQGQPVTTRTARMDWLKAQVETPLVICKLGEIARLTPKRKKELSEPKFIVVTSQEIDRHGEEASDEEETRLYMDEVLDKLRRGIRNLLQVGVRHIVIAADHGFIFAEGLDAGLSMDAPGGETVELHSRAWIGRGGVSADGFFRANASDLELGGPLELAFPRSIGLFKVKGGSGPYFHGGPTLQEQVIPVCVLKARKARAEVSSELKLELKLAKPKVTNRFFSLTVTLTAEGLFGETQKRIRLEALSAKTEVGYAAVASYGYEEGTREIAIVSGKPNAVTMMLTATDAVTKISLRAIDCETQLVLGELTDIPVELAI
jgi:hypothetical protein